MPHDFKLEDQEIAHQEQLEKEAKVLAKEKSLSFEEALQHHQDAQAHDESTGPFDDIEIPR